MCGPLLIPAQFPTLLATFVNRHCDTSCLSTPSQTARCAYWCIAVSEEESDGRSVRAPFLLLLTAAGMQRMGGVRPLAVVLIGASVVVTVWGVWWGTHLGW